MLCALSGDIGGLTQQDSTKDGGAAINSYEVQHRQGCG